ncbi:hypothetical protein A3860_32955 [Niastella vici]|uniref:Uncharacterized protein n=1 Tax=Niastella vici TaxID=1703345 RepID=A0A1V9FQJ1_9BACT|nr:hypothetical protein A3860_32955 [Niastella vici]
MECFFSADGPSRPKNETLQIYKFEGFFNLNYIEFIHSKSIIALILNTLEQAVWVYVSLYADIGLVMMNYQFTIPVTGAIGSFDKIYSVRQALQVRKQQFIKARF